MIQMSVDYSNIENILKLSKNDKLSKLQNRIMQQIKFVNILNQRNNGKYSHLLEKSGNILEKCYIDNGVITSTAVEEVEKVLMPISEEAKSYEYLCVAHAHIDMNWMWGYDETVSTTIDTFRTMLNLMNEYKDYHFSQSQASVYKIVEENDPEMLEEIKQRVKEGRWEVTASTWVETDKNIPTGESLSRHILYTKKYIEQLFGIPQDELVIDFEPDTFGHNKNVPEILNQGGIKYYYHCRGQVGENILQRWVAPSGKDILVYTEPFWYNSTIDYDLGEYAPTLADLTKSKTLLKVYGVGDHGGGPTRCDIERLIEMNSWPIYPKFTFSTLKQYFAAIDKNKDILPTINDEINFLCDGCYTTQTTIKEGNRKSEKLLKETEIYNVLANNCTDKKYPKNLFETAWQKTLFNQFHDIIPGSGVTQTREYASGLYQQVFATAETTMKSALKSITDNIDTSVLNMCDEDISFTVSEGAGSGDIQCGTNAGKQRIYHIFNSTAFDRRKITEITVWDYNGDYSKLEIKDSKGNNVEYQITDEGHYWGHNYKKVLVDVFVKACGYETIILSDTKSQQNLYHFINDMRTQSVEEFILENDKIKVELDWQTGAIASIIDKKTGKELVDKTRKTGVFKLATEAVKKQVTNWNGGMSAWFTGRYKHIDEVNDNIEMVVHQTGSLRQSIKYETKFKNSTITVMVSLDKYSTSLNYDVVCDWREFGCNEKGVPTLFFYLPLNYNCDNYEYDIPFGTTQRKSQNIEYPASGYTFAPNVNGDKSFMLLSKNKHAFRCCDNSMSLTLIRGAYDPDPTPEIKTHNIKFSVNILDSNNTSKENLIVSESFSHDFKVVTGTNHKGVLPLSNSFFEVVDGSVVISAIKMSEYSDDIVIRVYETNGVDTDVIIKTKFNCTKAKFVDITERHFLNEEIHIDKQTNTINFTVPANSIKTIVLSK